MEAPKLDSGNATDLYFLFGILVECECERVLFFGQKANAWTYGLSTFTNFTIYPLHTQTTEIGLTDGWTDVQTGRL